jgi:hypothetical protein
VAYVKENPLFELIRDFNNWHLVELVGINANLLAWLYDYASSHREKVKLIYEELFKMLKSL